MDFSDRLRVSRRAGYSLAWRGEEEVEEEALAKYRRLSREARQLQEEVGRASSREEGLSEATLATLGVEVDLLHRHLLSLRLEEVVVQGGTRETQDPPARQKLLAQLEGLKAPAPGSGSQGSSQSPSQPSQPVPASPSQSPTYPILPDIPPNPPTHPSTQSPPLRLPCSPAPLPLPCSPAATPLPPRLPVPDPLRLCPATTSLSSLYPIS